MCLHDSILSENGVSGNPGAVQFIGLALVQVAQAIAEGRVRPTISDLDRLIRLEEFLKEDLEKSQMKVIINWTEMDKDGNVVTRREYGGAATPDEED